MDTNTLNKNITFDIYNEDGTPFHDLKLRKSVSDSVVMSLSDKITGDVYYKDNNLKVTMKEYVEYRKNPYDKTETPVKFILVNPPTIVRNGTISEGSEIGGMTKYSFEFYHPMYLLSNLPFSDVAVSSDEEKFLSQNKTFSWVGNGYSFIDKINKCLQGTEWIVVASDNKKTKENLSLLPSEIPSERTEEQEKSDVLTFDKQFVSDALKTLYDIWKIPYVIDTLNEGEYFYIDKNNNKVDYYSEQGGSKRFVVVFGSPSNEITSFVRSGKGLGAVGYNGAYYYNKMAVLLNAKETIVLAHNKYVLQAKDVTSESQILKRENVGDVISTNGKYYAEENTFVVLGSKTPINSFDYNIRKSFVFRFGRGVGLKNNSRTPRNNKIVTRLAGCGSENNIPYGYPQIIWTGNQEWDYTINNASGMQTITVDGKTIQAMSYPIYDGIVGGQKVRLIKHPFTRKNLMPSVYTKSVNKKVNPLADGYDPNTELVDYYDAVGDEFPNKINPLAPSYFYRQFDGIKPELDRERVLGIVDAVPLNEELEPVEEWDDTMDENGEYKQSYFQITLPKLDFDIYACAAITQEMQINMRSGACIGCTFTIQVDWDDYKKNFYDSDCNFVPDGYMRDLTKYPKSNLGQIKVVVQKDINTFGTLMPNTYQKPKADDLFVILGISLPSEYISDAEAKLDEAMLSYMLENNIYYYDYPLRFDEHFLTKHSDILQQISPNTAIRFEFAGEEKRLFVKQITKKYGISPLPQYDITLTDNIEVVLNQVSQVEDNVEHLGTLMSTLRQLYRNDSTSELAKKLSKVTDDIALGFITFVKGIAANAKSVFVGIENKGNLVNTGRVDIGGNIDVAGSGVVDSINSHNYSGSGMLDTGWQITNNDGTGSSKLSVDKLYVRKKAIFEVLEVKKWEASGGDQIITRARTYIDRVDYLDENGNKLGYSTLRMPFVLRGVMSMFRKGSGIRNIVSRMNTVRVVLSEEDAQKIKSVRCYFLAKDGEQSADNWWRVGDLARCQTQNIVGGERDSFLPQSLMPNGNTYWWRKIIGISTNQSIVTIENKEYHYFDVECDVLNETAASPTRNPREWCDADSDIPVAGDVAIQFGYYGSNAEYKVERTNAITLEVSGGDAPAFKEYKGIGQWSGYDQGRPNWSLNGKRKTMVSPTSGNEFYSPRFVIETEDGDRDLGGKNLMDYHDWYDNIHKINTDDDDYHESIFVRVENEVFDVYSPIVYLKKGRYCFSAYMQETVDDVFIQAKKSSKYSEDYGQYTDVQTDSTDEGDGWIRGTFNLAEDCFVVLEIGTGTEFIFEYGLEINNIQLERGSNRTEYTTYYIPQNTDSRFEVTRGSIEMEVSDSEGRTNRRIQTVEQTVSEISDTRSKEDLFDKGLSYWRINDETFSNAYFDADNIRYYDKIGDYNDIYSPVVSLKAGTYCFSAYVPEDRVFDIHGNTIALQQGCTIDNPSEGTTINAYNYGDISGDTINVNGTTYYRRYAIFVITADRLCSINLWGSAEDADVVRPKLELGSKATPWTATTSVIKQTADEINMSVRDDLGEVGININGSDKSVKLIGDKVGFVGRDGKKEYIKVGIDTSGLPYFIFLDKDGNEAYNLGWGGLQQIANNSVADKWYGTMLTNKITDGLEVQPSDIPALYDEMIAPYNPKWLFLEGYIVNAQGNRIYNISKTSEPSSYNNSYFNSKATVQQSGSFVPSDPIADGWYAVNTGSHAELSLFYTNGGEIVYSGFIISLGHDQRVIDGVVSYEHYIIQISGNGYSSVGHRTTKGTAVIADSPVVFPSYI